MLRLAFTSLLLVLIFSSKGIAQCYEELTVISIGDVRETAASEELVWTRTDSEILLYKNGNTINLSNNPFTDWRMAADGKTVVWAGLSSSSSSTSKIYSSTDGGAKQEVSDNRSTTNSNPDIKGNLIVYQGYINGVRHIFKNDNGTITQVSDGASTDNEVPKTDGTNIVWQGQVGGLLKVFIDSGSGPQQIDPTYPGNQANPLIDNGRVVWRGSRQDGGNTVFELFEYLNGTTTKISGNQTLVNSPDFDIDGEDIVWINGEDDGRMIYKKGINSPVLVSTHSVRNQLPKVDNGRISWIGFVEFTSSSNQTFLLDEIFIDRGQGQEELPTNHSSLGAFSFDGGIISFTGRTTAGEKGYAFYIDPPSFCCTGNRQLSTTGTFSNTIHGNIGSDIVWSSFDNQNTRDIFINFESSEQNITMGNYPDISSIGVSENKIYFTSGTADDIYEYDNGQIQLIPTTTVFDKDPLSVNGNVYWIGRPTGSASGETEVFELKNGVETLLSTTPQRVHTRLTSNNGMVYWAAEANDSNTQVFQYNPTNNITAQLSNNPNFSIDKIGFLNGQAYWTHEDGSGNLHLFTNTSGSPVQISQTPLVDNVNFASFHIFNNQIIWQSDEGGSSQVIKAYDGSSISDINLGEVPFDKIVSSNTSALFWDEITGGKTYLERYDGNRSVRLTDNDPKPINGVREINGSTYVLSEIFTNQRENHIFILECGGDCPQNLSINPITESRYGAEVRIESDATLMSTSDVLFSAGQEVLLLPMFTAESMGGLEVVIQPCSAFLQGN